MDHFPKATNKEAERTFVVSGPEEVFLPLEEEKRSGRSFLRPKIFLFGSATFLFLLALGFSGFLFFKGITLSSKLQFENTPSSSLLTQLKTLSQTILTEKSSLRGETDGRINILLLGRAGEHYPGRNLTDTVMVMSINTQEKRVALLSLPRDLYVPISKTNLYTKLNSLYQYGLSREEGMQPVEETVAYITGQPIHYFITLDFDGFERIVDTLGGISVDVVRDFYDPRYPGKNYSYETFEIKKGWQTLDGATALKYVRERHNDPEGDFGRAKRQQQVIQAIKTKAFSMGTLFNIVTVNRLLDTLGESVKTDMSIEDMARFLELSHTLDTRNVTTVVVDAWKKESLLRVSHVDVNGVAAFILVPRVGNFSEIQDVSQNIFHREEQEKRLAAIKNEEATLTLFSTPSDQATARKITAFVQEEMGFTKASLVTSLNKRPEKSIMTTGGALTKPFSLDELLKRLSVTETPALPEGLSDRFNSDYAIVIGDDLIETFSVPEPTNEALTQEDPSFSEPLPPQPKKK